MEFKKIWEKVSAFFNRYINGTKGAISLFLAFLLTPILTLALVLVESARYQSIVQLVEELSDLCAMSSLASYDTYVQDRFGLLSVSQQEEISDLFKEAMEENKELLGNTVTYTQAPSAFGAIPLSTDKVFFQQVVEQSEFSVLAKTVYDGLDLQDLLSQLTDKLGWDRLDEIMTQAELMKNTADLADAAVDLLKCIKEMNTANDELKSAVKAYKNAYSNTNAEGVVSGFEPDALALIEALNNAQGEDKYKDSNVKNAVDASKSSAKNYRDKAKDVEKALGKLMEKASALQNRVDSLDDILADYQSNNAKLNSDGEGTPVFKDMVVTTLLNIYDSLSEAVSDRAITQISSDVSAIQGQISKLNSLIDGDMKAIPSTWVEADIESNYGPLSLPDNFGNVLKTAIRELENPVDSEEPFLKKLLDILDKLMHIQVFYDKSLDSVVSTSLLHESSSPELDDMLIIASIQTFFDAGKRFTSEGNILKKFVDYVVGIAEVIVAAATLLISIVTWALNFVGNVFRMTGTLFTDPAGWFEQMLFTGYCAYNLPNRTNCTSEKSLTGYDYQKVFLEQGGDLAAYDARIFGGNFGDKLGNQSGTDTGFKGAELEYIMVGSQSEYENQATSFFKLYLFRILFNLFPVLTSPEYSRSHWAVIVAVLLVEPLIDTIFLVNGEKEYLVKQDLYLSIDSLDEVLEKLSNITLGESASKMAKGFFGKEDEPGTGGGLGVVKDLNFLKCDYTDHLYLYMFITYEPGNYVNRLQNIVQTEANTHYTKTEGVSFDLDQAYTHVCSSVSYQLNPIFNVDVLTSGGIFDVYISRYTGY